MSDVCAAPLTYRDRLQHLAERKLDQTREKIDRF